MSFNKFQKISISFFLVIFLFSIFYFSPIAKAVVVCDDPYSPYYDPVQCGSNISVTCSQYQYPWCQEAKGGPGPLVGRFYIIALGLAAAAALGVLIYGAILWTVSGAVTSKQDAKEWISGALWGLVLLLGAYLILYTINPDLVKLKGPEELFKMKSMNLQLVSPLAVAGTSPSEAASDAEIRQKLAQVSNGKITVNAPAPHA